MQLPFKPRSLNRDRPLKRLDASKPLSPDMRFAIFGPIHGMDYPTLIDRILGR